MGKTLKGIIVVGVIIVIMIAIFLIFRNKAEEEQTEYGKLTIQALNDYDEKIRIGYEISYYERTLENGTTISNGVITTDIEAGKEIKLQTHNINDQNYYTYITDDIKITNTTHKQVILHPQNPGDIKLEKHSNLSDGNANFSIKAKDGEIRNVGMCVKWSDNIVYAKPKDSNEIEPPQRYALYDDCFELTDVVENNLNITLKYENWGALDKNDNIKIVVFDGDSKISGVKYGKEEDICAEDKKIIINNI